MVRKKTHEEFIREVEEKFPGKFLLDKTEYKNAITKTYFGCPVDGYYWQATPNSILNGYGCPKCGIEKNALKRTKSNEEFIREVEEKYPGKFLLDRVEYKNAKTKIWFGCPIHNSYWLAQPSNILNGRGCPKCGIEKMGVSNSITQEEFIREVEEKYPGKFLLDRVEYLRSHEKTWFGCSIHGYWEATPNSILNGKGCPKCGIEIQKTKQTKTQEEFIREVEEKFPGKFLLDRTQYKNSQTKTYFGCPIHNHYWEARPNCILRGSGCPKCKSSKGELFIESLLKQNNIIFETQKRFKTCRYKQPLPFDFYLLEHNILIEYDGRQHFEPVKAFGGKKEFKLVKKKDQIKTKWAADNNIHLIRFSYKDDEEQIKQIIDQL